jgi:hypothetical protein
MKLILEILIRESLLFSHLAQAANAKSPKLSAYPCIGDRINVPLLYPVHFEFHYTPIVVLCNSHIMSNLDAHVASVLDTAHSDDEDALIASLEDSPALDAFREQRIQQLHSELSRAKAQKNQGFGNYTEIKEEKALMELTTEVKYAVVHFAKDDFARCGVMDEHLEGR